MAGQAVFLLLAALLIGALALLLVRRLGKTSAPQATIAEPAAVPPPPATPAAADVLVNETVSVVLRRQIPIRFDEAPRSWLGGLPCMPLAMEWPRSVSAEYPDRGDRPLHFLAQIRCADLPSDLWGERGEGRGPRAGWLLLFIDPNQGCPEGPDAFRILHISDDGTGLPPERPAPFDIGPVYDGVYSGAGYRHLLPDAAVPSQWRRWPIDLVCVPNQARQVDRLVLVTPDDFSQALYAGAPVMPEPERPKPTIPFTYGQALHALGDVLRRIDHVPAPRKLSEPFLDLIREDGAIPAIIDQCRQEAHALEQRRAAQALAAEGDPQQRARQQSWMAEQVSHYRDCAHWLGQLGNAEAVIADLAEYPARHQAWGDRLRAHCQALMAALRDQPADTPLEPADWQDLQASFAGSEAQIWVDDWHRGEVGKVAIPFRRVTLSAVPDIPAAMPELIAEMYVDPARQALIPDDLRAEYESWWRRLYDNRPHRMGGYHDGVQSDAVIGPTRELLMFQIASDDAMHWCWGDAGAWYFWIRPADLEAGDYSRVTVTLECH